MMDFDIVLSEIGDFGRYQVFLVAACAWSMIPFSCNIAAVIFLGYHEPSRCAFPEIDSNFNKKNISEERLEKVLLPWINENEGYSSCAKYNYQRTPCANNSILCVLEENQENFTRGLNSTVVDCTDGYHYDRSLFTETITSEWDLVCGRSGLRSLATALLCLGMLLGSLVGGNIADRYGRVRTMVCATVLNISFGIACSFSPNFTVFAILRCLIGAASVAIQIAMATYTVEIVGRKYRPWVGLLVGIVSGIGYMCLSLLAFLFRHWRTLQLVFGLISIPFLLLVPLVPESPRLLFAQGKIEKAKKICRLIAQRNGRKLDETVWEKANLSGKHLQDKQSCSPIQILRFSRVFLLLVMSTVLWFVSGLIFFCLSFNVGHWSGSPFLNNALSGLVEFLACLIVVPIINKFGRRKTIITSLTIAGLCIILAEIIKNIFGNTYAVGIIEVSIQLAAKFTISGSFNMLFLYAAELFPTQIRNTALGVSTVGGRAASIVAPFLIELQHIVSWALPVILGVLSLTTALMACKCPETKGMRMLTSLKEAEQFYRGKKKFDLDKKNNNKDDYCLQRADDFIVHAELIDESSA